MAVPEGGFSRPGGASSLPTLSFDVHGLDYSTLIRFDSPSIPLLLYLTVFSARTILLLDLTPLGLHSYPIDDAPAHLFPAQ